jgi:hypothetical protein
MCSKQLGDNSSLALCKLHTAFTLVRHPYFIVNASSTLNYKIPSYQPDERAAGCFDPLSFIYRWPFGILVRGGQVGC